MMCRADGGMTHAQVAWTGIAIALVAGAVTVAALWLGEAASLDLERSVRRGGVCQCQERP